MELTKEQVIDLSIELWEWVVKNNNREEKWSRWGQEKLGCVHQNA